MRNYNMKRTNLRNSGFTLVELMIYMFLSIIVLGIITTTFVYISDAYNRTSSAFDVQRRVETGIEQVRRDLSQTSLNSIQVYPKSGDRKPGVSMITACQEEKVSTHRSQDSFTMSQYGVPKWWGHVFYTVIPREPQPGEVGTDFQGKLGSLVRWTLPLDDKDSPPYPFPTNILPRDFNKNRAVPRVILRGIPLPDSPRLKGLDHFKTDGVDYGGFQVAFVRQEKDNKGGVTREYLSTRNPADFIGKSDTKASSELVQVNITNIYISERSGKLSAYSFSFCVYPRN